MFKTINIAINKFPVTPPLLMDASGAVRSSLDINLAALYHHYYLDCYGRVPPNPDPAQFEHVQLLTTQTELRVRGDGLGANPATRQHRSNELGQAFFRWFLDQYLDIPFFAHMHDALQGRLTNMLNGFEVERIAGGDAPDYLCASDANHVFLGEAKGRIDAISFGSKDFATWRKQFDRVKVTDPSGTVRSVKGFIVAIRFARESQPRVKSLLLAEDPATRGEPFRDGSPALRNVVVSLHYGSVAQKLDQPLLAAALRTLTTVPAEILFPVVTWECLFEPFKGLLFVGGYYQSEGGHDPFMMTPEGATLNPLRPLRLDLAKGTFFGLELGQFKRIVEAARGGTDTLSNLRALNRFPFVYSAISYLRDGSILGPAEMFRPVNIVTF
ncbi:hypothetical protein GR211_33265 [Rhizobium leguminosarum]|uniref:hypothetical protein n=1 Tax=Rhizobium ruizarguesonis TaxID=2081791 RepID=UPI0013BD5452|nr:hypothetical protein [Rhizobium ruizarguesonis]NEJ17719.1 hypothetical protein [Rhizobium ruizarguesonis]NEK31697.1 hypothetical protein [Rhizobium ruizarguesonis]